MPVCQPSISTNKCSCTTNVCALLQISTYDMSNVISGSAEHHIDHLRRSPGTVVDCQAQPRLQSHRCCSAAALVLQRCYCFLYLSAGRWPTWRAGQNDRYWDLSGVSSDRGSVLQINLFLSKGLTLVTAPLTSRIRNYWQRGRREDGTESSSWL